MENNNRFKKILENPDIYNIEKGDSEIYDSNEPRNMLANTVNPLLDKFVNPTLEKAVGTVNDTLGTNIPENVNIPQVSRADVKDNFNEFIKSAGTSVGSVGKFANQAQDAGKVVSALTQNPSKGIAKSYVGLMEKIQKGDFSPAMKQALEIRAEKLKTLGDKYGDTSNSYLTLFDELWNTANVNNGYSRLKAAQQKK